MDNIVHTLSDLDNVEIARSIACDYSELHNHILINKNDLTIISQNIRSIYHNFDDFIINVSTLNLEIDIIILTECRLSPNKPIPQINNYHSYMTTRQLNQNDGVVVYVKCSIKHKIEEIQLDQASCLRLEALGSEVYCIYRSPSNHNIDRFVESLSTHLNMKSSQKNTIVAGDININIKPRETESTQDLKNRVSYLNMLAGFGILPGHTLATRGQNCLDHFMLNINKKRLSASIAILHFTITDHYTTFLSLTKLKNNYIPNKTTTILNYEQALKDLQEKKLSELLFCDDPDSLITSFIDTLTSTIKDNTIITKIPNSKRIIKPWITMGILRCIKNRNNLQKQSRNDPYNDILKITYIRYRNYCNNLIKKIKRKYERDLLAKSVNNNKMLWKNIKNITYSNKIKSQNLELLNIKPTSQDSINYINDYFANVGKKLAQQIQPSLNNVHIPVHPDSSPPNTFVLLDTDVTEVNGILMNLKSDSAPGWDNISTKFLKFVRKEVVPVITHLANICLQQGVFPSPLKQSIITPVHKGGGRDDVNNYRPISVLPAISKILEKIINSRLTKFLNKFNLLSPSQFGFRQAVSTEDAVTALTSHITEQLDMGNKCLAIFLDLKKAFDTVSVPILVNKLQKVGIRGTALSLLIDYLSNRKQKVKIGQHLSDEAEVSYGVPQGSVLGPTLFLIYINDLCNIKLINSRVLAYADDTAVVFAGNTWHDVRLSAEAGIAHIAEWLKNNLLTLNTTKTNFICFSVSNRTQPNNDLNLRVHTCGDTNSISCNCPFLNRVPKTKYLGVMVDQFLSWYPHLEHVNGRVRKLTWMFKTLRHVASTKMLRSDKRPRNLLNEIYIALAQSVLLYCIPIWGGAAKTRFMDVERAQRALIKVMYFKNKRYSTKNLYEFSGLLSVRKLYITQLVLKTHKTLPYKVSTTQKRRNDKIAAVTQCKTKFASRQFCYLSARLYNRINKNINVHNKNYYNCKKTITNYIKSLTYDDTEALLVYHE